MPILKSSVLGHVSIEASMLNDGESFNISKVAVGCKLSTLLPAEFWSLLPSTVTDGKFESVGVVRIEEGSVRIITFLKQV